MQRAKPADFDLARNLRMSLHAAFTGAPRKERYRVECLRYRNEPIRRCRFKPPRRHVVSRRGRALEARRLAFAGQRERQHFGLRAVGLPSGC